MKIIILLLIIALSGCKTTGPKENTNNHQIVIDNRILQEEDIAFWFIHSAGKKSCQAKHNEYTFLYELCSFNFATFVYLQDTEDDIDNSASDFKKDLQALVEQNLLKEYYWTHFKKSWWFVEKDLELDRYHEYIKSNPLQHSPHIAEGISVENNERTQEEHFPFTYNKSYPITKGNLTFDSIKSFDKETQGVALTYYYDGSEVKLDVYIYPEVKNYVIDDQYQYASSYATLIKLPIYYLSQRGMYGPIKEKSESFLTLPEIPNVIAKGVYQYQQDGGESLSYFYITHVNNHFIKVRVSTSIEQKNIFERDVLDLIKDIIQRI